MRNSERGLPDRESTARYSVGHLAQRNACTNALSVFSWVVPVLPGLRNSRMITSTLGGGISPAFSCAIPSPDHPASKHSRSPRPVDFLMDTYSGDEMNDSNMGIPAGKTPRTVCSDLTVHSKKKRCSDSRAA